MSNKTKAAWNKDKSKSVVLAKLKEFTVTPNGDNKWFVRGWYNETNSFLFGDWPTEKEAQDFLETIHNML